MKRSVIATMALASVGAVIAGSSILVNKSKTKTSKDYDLKEKTVFITGGSRGLGLSLAREFAAAGSNVIICAQDAHELDEAKSQLKDMGYDVTTVQCDVTNHVEAEATIHAIQIAHKPIDILINNAGVMTVGPLDSMTRDDYEEAMDTHFWAVCNTIEAVLPEMKQHKEGKIVNISSMDGKIPAPHLAPYTASKFALVGYSEAMRIELADQGITVTTVCPGFMRTTKEEYSWFTIADTLPGISTDIDEAAKQIVAACKNGEAEINITAPASIAVKVYGIWPSKVIDTITSINRFLPKPGGIRRDRVKGKESHPSVPSAAQPAT